jgi:hypothetical protein
MEVLLKETLLVILLRGVTKQSARYRLEINKELGLRFIIQKCKGNAELISSFLQSEGGAITLNVEDTLPKPSSPQSPVPALANMGGLASKQILAHSPHQDLVQPERLQERPLRE